MTTPAAATSSTLARAGDRYATVSGNGVYAGARGSEHGTTITLADVPPAGAEPAPHSGPVRSFANCHHPGAASGLQKRTAENGDPIELRLLYTERTPGGSGCRTSGPRGSWEG